MNLKNLAYKSVGVGFLALAKAKSLSVGYDRARPFSQNAVAQAIEYDKRVVDEWLAYLSEYTNLDANQIRGRTILELGPGPDFGIGLYFLSLDVDRYCALDAFELAYNAPHELHQRMADLVTQGHPTLTSQGLLEHLPKKDFSRANSRIDYVVRRDFNILLAFPKQRFDFVFSQAAFEHFDDPDESIRQLAQVTVPGGKLIAGIDLQTHTRWIREKDPLNIYRYSDRFYRQFQFPGMPNRVSTSQYVESLKRWGWQNIQVKGIGKTDPEYFSQVKESLAKSYRNDQSENLWIVICATRGT